MNPKKKSTGLEKILDSNYRQDILRYIISKSTNIKLSNIKSLKVSEYEIINEYDFSLNKLNLETNNKDNIDIYMRVVEKGKVKESVFSYWNFAIQNELISKYKIDFNKDKIFIKEINIDEYKKEISLQFKSHDEEKKDKEIMIYFIQLQQYLRYREEKIEYLEYLKDFEDSELFIATVMN